MAHTYKVTVLAQAIMNKIDANKDFLQIDEVYYGDQQNLPAGKCVAVWPAYKRRPLAGVQGPGGYADNMMEVNIMVYYSVLETEAEARLAADQLSEDIEDLLHQDTTMGGILIHGWCDEWIPGEVFRDNSMFRTVRLHYFGRTKTGITP